VLCWPEATLSPCHRSSASMRFSHPAAYRP
jgi:hypothetical protein